MHFPREAGIYFLIRTLKVIYTENPQSIYIYKPDIGFVKFVYYIKRHNFRFVVSKNEEDEGK